ncbi:hypothetical protein CDV55_107794 [Aspergillus turcosus]|nr:hypothetical protein CDV55_107794 [Aspergillus turcosus]
MHIFWASNGLVFNRPVKIEVWTCDRGDYELNQRASHIKDYLPRHEVLTSSLYAAANLRRHRSHQLEPPESSRSTLQHSTNYHDAPPTASTQLHLTAQASFTSPPASKPPHAVLRLDAP